MVCFFLKLQNLQGPGWSSCGTASIWFVDRLRVRDDLHHDAAEREDFFCLGEWNHSLLYSALIRKNTWNVRCDKSLPRASSRHRTPQVLFD